MNTHGPLWDNAEFMEWFNSRPEKIQAAIRACPPWQFYRVQGGIFQGQIYGYDEEDDGSVSMKVDINAFPFGRRVFGLKPSHLELWDDEKADMFGDIPVMKEDA